MDINNFSPREYQIEISKKCLEKNTLVCLPTGTGKTKVGILVAVARMNLYSGSKVMVLTPTKPLAQQICNEFKNYTSIDENKITLLTGSLTPSKRVEFYNSSDVIVATPQTIEKDFENLKFNFKNFSLLIVDECHRSKENFANTKVAKAFIETSNYPRIVGLTASPGSTKEVINEVCMNLNIEAIEIKTENDEGLKEFIQKKEIQHITVDFPSEFKKIHNLLKEEYNSKLEGVRSFGVTKPFSIINKTDLITLQRNLVGQIKNNNKSVFYGIFLVSYLLKLNYALELLETQSPSSVKDFLDKIKNETSKASKSLSNNSKIKQASIMVDKLIEENIKHPKMVKLKEILRNEITSNANYKAIVFANYRNMVNEIVDFLKKDNINSYKFIGQADRKDKGLKQKEQIEIINNFKNNKFNVLVASSVGEEGIDIPEVNAVIFYESIGSELRKIQRTGRTGRTKPGKIIFLMAEGTRDFGYFFSSLNKERKMQKTLSNMRESNLLKYA